MTKQKWFGVFLLVLSVAIVAIGALMYNPLDEQSRTDVSAVIFFLIPYGVACLVSKSKLIGG